MINNRYIIFAIIFLSIVFSCGNKSRKETEKVVIEKYMKKVKKRYYG